MSFADRFPTFARNWTILRESWRNQDEIEQKRKRISDHEFLPAALEIVESPPSPGLRYLLLGLCALFSFALLWSFVGKLDVVATASGKVIPVGNVKIIQPMQIGYVRVVHVKNGKWVKAGELLVELDPTLAVADAEQATQSLLSADVMAARNTALLAYLQGRPARFTHPPDTPSDIAETQANFVRNVIAEYEGARASLQHQRAEQQARLQGAEAEITKLIQTLPLVDEQLEARKKLAQRGYFSKIRLIEYEQLKVEHTQNIEVQRAQADQARALIRKIDAQLMELKGSFGKSAVAELAEAQKQSAQAREEVTKSVRRKQYLELRAPVSGTVQQLAVTVGGVVQPAQAIMTIVPDDTEVMVEAQIRNKDIGFIREGQPVRVKLEAYNFTDYGIIPGVIDSISRDAINMNAPVHQAANAAYEQDMQQALVYSARIRLKQRYIRVRGRNQLIGPGLAVKAEIKTGERRIIDFLLSPIAKSIDEAGRER